MRAAKRSLLLASVLVSVPLWSAVAIGKERVPRVLILGDQVYQQPARSAAKELKGRAEVVFATLEPGRVRGTTTALETLHAMLGEGRWDLIHFNFGLGDLVYRAPQMKAFRVMAKSAGGVRATNSQQYEKNLHKLVKRLRATNAKLVWASTTPIRSTPNDIFDLGSEIEYNAIAVKVMAIHNVPINDMHTEVTALIDMNRPAPHGWDPFYFDRKPLYPLLVAKILSELGLPTLQAETNRKSR